MMIFQVVLKLYSSLKLDLAKRMFVNQILTTDMKSKQTRDQTSSSFKVYGPKTFTGLYIDYIASSNRCYNGSSFKLMMQHLCMFIPFWNFIFEVVIVYQKDQKDLTPAPIMVRFPSDASHFGVKHGESLLYQRQRFFLSMCITRLSDMSVLVYKLHPWLLKLFLPGKRCGLIHRDLR